MSTTKTKRGRPEKEPRVIDGHRYWHCPRPPKRGPMRRAHWVIEGKMSMHRGKPHTYCKECNAEIARDWRAENHERVTEIKRAAAKRKKVS